MLLADAYDRDQGFQLYEATNGDHSVRIAEHLTVDADKITANEIIADAAAFGAFMAG